MVLRIPNSNVFFNSVLQLIFSIFRNFSFTSPFNSRTEGATLKCFLETAHNAYNSNDVHVLNFQLVHHVNFYNGQILQDSTKCLLMLRDIINKGSMLDSSSTTGASLSDILLSFVLENIFSAMYEDSDPPHLCLAVCYILHLLMHLPCKTWYYKECNKNLDVIKTLGTSNQTIFYNLQNICFSS